MSAQTIQGCLSTAKFRQYALQTLESVAGFNIPAYDSVALSGYGAGTNPTSAVYSNKGVQVAHATLTYDGSGNLTNITVATP